MTFMMTAGGTMGFALLMIAAFFFFIGSIAFAVNRFFDRSHARRRRNTKELILRRNYARRIRKAWEQKYSTRNGDVHTDLLKDEIFWQEKLVENDPHAPQIEREKLKELRSRMPRGAP